jgi:hypothetical protein
MLTENRSICASFLALPVLLQPTGAPEGWHLQVNYSNAELRFGAVDFSAHNIIYMATALGAHFDHRKSVHC